MKKILGLVFAVFALTFLVVPADAAKTKVVVKNGNVRVNSRGNGAANVNVQVGGAGRATNAVVVNNAHANTFVANTHAGFAVATHHNNVAFVSHAHAYNHVNFAVVQPVTFAVATPLTVATVPVDVVNAPAVVTTQTTYATPATTVGCGVVAAQAYVGTQQVVKTQVLKTVNVPVAVGVHAGY